MTLNKLLVLFLLLTAPLPLFAGDNETFASCMSEGNRFYTEGSYRLALKWYTQAVDKNPESFEALMCRGLTHHKLGDNRQALSDLNRAAALGSENAAVFNNRGNVLASLGLFDEALADFNRALTLKPDYEEALFNRGRLYRVAGFYDEALTDLDLLLKRAPQAWIGFYERGMVQLARGLAPLALADFSRCQTLNDQYPDVYLARGKTYIMLEQYTRAIDDLNRYLAFIPDSGEGMMYRAVAWNFAGYPDRSLADFNEALTKHPDEPLLLYGRGELYLSLRRYREAADDFRKVAGLRPDWTSALEKLAEAEGALTE